MCKVIRRDWRRIIMTEIVANIEELAKKGSS